MGALLAGIGIEQPMATEVPPNTRSAEHNQHTENGHSNGTGAVTVALETPPAPQTAIPVSPVATPATADGGGRPPKRGKPTLGEAFIAFRLRDFRYLTLSTLAVGYGQWAQQIGLFLLVYEVTGSAAQLGLLAAFRGGIGVVVAPIGGILADRYPRRMIIVWSTAFGAILAAVLATLILTDLIVVWQMYAVALLGGVLQSVNQPARQAFVYDVTTDETLPNAVAMNSIAQNVARISGPVLAGAMVGFLGIASPFIFIVVVQSIAMALTLMISRSTRQQPITRGQSALRQTIEGFKYSWDDKPILGLILVSAIPSLLVYPYIPFMAVVSDELGQGEFGFGLLTSMMGWGSIVGLTLLASMGDRPDKGRLMLGGFLVYTSLLIVFAFSRVFVLSLAILAIAGIFHSVAMALNNTLIQLAVKNEMRGRVMAVWQMSHGLQPLGSLPMGLLVGAYGAQIGIGAFMITATIIFALFTIFWASVRRM
jgi:MFS family permease